MTTDNAGQIAYWNGPNGEMWAKLREKRDRDHAFLTDALLDRSNPRPGERVLDIGCGSGTTTLKLAERVAPNGYVLGIDISRPMLGVARRRAIAAKSSALFAEGDVTDYYEFEPQSFDLAFSQLGVMFFADPVAAFANVKRAMKPAARLHFACWRSPAEHLWAFVPESAAKPFLPPSPPADPNAPGRYAFQNPDHVKNLLLQAGFHDPEFEKLDTQIFAGATPEEAADAVIEGGPLQRTLTDADETTRAKVRAAVTERLAKEMGPNGIYLTSAAWLVGASV
ncbi:MAG TPA: methyltransferase domain-containing protein [Micropepsaceae bacterium]|jgi:SAM-dependent methyltransferase|nr:methyltransferase domain-containing protein [Micropepsaceae bacterium]